MDLPPPPRKVRRRKGRGALIGCIPIILVPLTIGAAIALFFAILSSLVPLFGVTVQGAVVGTSINYTSRPAGTTYRMEYAYDFRGKTYAGDEDVTESEFGNLQTGEPVDIRLFPLAPNVGQRVAVDGRYKSYRDLVTLWVILLVWNGLLWVNWSAMLLTPLASRSLVIRGQAAAGKIVERQQAIRRSATFTVRYLFDTPSVQGVEGSMAVRLSDWDSAKEGKPVAVLYSSKQPSHSLIYEYADYEII